MLEIRPTKPDVKRSFVLPKALDQKVSECAKRHGLSYSEVLRQAIEVAFYERPQEVA